jgi:hypothetical protein
MILEQPVKNLNDTTKLCNIQVNFLNNNQQCLEYV